MRKILHTLLLTVACIFTVQAQQQVQLFIEDFESGGQPFILNSGGPAAASGQNRWTVNNEYNGSPLYPNTTSQSNTTFGTIQGAPFSTYLHIRDSIAQGSNSVSNCNFKKDAASDNFAFSNIGVCSRGLTDVKLVFFYVAGGDTVNTANPNSYGEVYYSADGGPWTLAKNTKYTKQSAWKYEQISNPAFNNVTDLKFGFRWVNNGNDTLNSMSFGIDEIQIVGTYDDINNPTDINIFNNGLDTVCTGEAFTILLGIGDTLCDGDYRLVLSNRFGTFNNGTTDLGFVTLASGLNFVNINGAVIPFGTRPAPCYKIRVDRISSPAIIGTPSSFCIVVQNCDNTIDTQPAVVLSDGDTTCIQSAIDVPFYSTGPFNPGNNYVAELSDSAGNFTNPQVIGSNPDMATYDPSTGSPPGNVSGLIPVTASGCNYYIRVRSTDPPTLGTLYGPFCLEDCDMTTNDTEDISVCVSQTVGIDTPINLQINSWDTTANYYDGNTFSVQVLDMMMFLVINTGGLGAYLDTASGTFNLHIPGRDSLQNIGLGAGTYYIRIIADSTSADWDANGTVVRLTIGAPDDVAPSIVLPDTLACNTVIVGLGISPYNQGSEYEWTWSTGFMDTSDANPYYVDFDGANPGNYQFRIREFSYGCAGPYSDVELLNIISSPISGIEGPQSVCEDDTVSFSVPFISTTYYEWGTNVGSITDTANNEINIVFDSTGSATLTNSALNRCGSNSFTYPVEIRPKFVMDAGQDVTACETEEVTLKAIAGERELKVATGFSEAINADEGMMFDLVASDALTLTSIEGKFKFKTNTPYEVYFKFGTHQGFETDASAWSMLSSGNITTAGPVGYTTIPLTATIGIPAGDTIALYVSIPNDTAVYYYPHTGASDIAATDGVLNIMKGKISLNTFAGTFADYVWAGRIGYRTTKGISYIWSTGDSIDEFTRTFSESDVVYVKGVDSLGCEAWDSLTLTINESPLVDLGDDQDLCLGEEAVIDAQAEGTYSWSPTDEVDSTVLYQTFYPSETTSYVLTATDDQTGCEASDTMTITVSVDLAGEDTVALCNEGDPVILELTDGTRTGTFEWSTGETTNTLTTTTPGTYTVNYFPGNNACAEQYVFEVRLIDCEQILDIPEAFTPNNDGLNDHFTIFGEDIVQFDITIYNRWGELVYSSSDAGELNDLNRGWDGTHKGKLQNVGTFVYYIKARNSTNISVEKQGNITLIR